MFLSFKDVKGIDLSKYQIMPAEVAWCPDLRSANELHNAVITAVPHITARSIWVNALGQWAVILVKDAQGETAHGTTSPS